MLLQTLLFALYFAAVIHCQGCLKDPAKIKRAMNAEDLQLRLVFAHRGIQTRIAVENSVQAVDEASKLDIDGVELDVQIAKDGTLWPCHDRRIGRITSYKASPQDSYFDPLHDDPLGPKNPAFKDMTHDQLNALFLRNTRGEVQEGVHFHSLEFVLNHIKANWHHIVVTLDVKTFDAVTPAAELVNRLGMQGQVVVKFLATWVPVQDVPAALKGVGFVVVTYVDMLDRFVELGTGQNPQVQVVNYLSGYFKYPNYVSMEAPTKNYYVSQDRTVVIPRGPGGFVDNWMTNVVNRGIGKFHVVKDFNVGAIDSLGHCCVDPNSFLSGSKYFGKELYPDQRFDASIVLKSAAWITTDAAAQVLADLVKAGYRNRRVTLC